MRAERAAPAGRQAQLFLHGQEGTLTVFSLVFFLAVLLSMGLAIELSRAETLRLSLRARLDRALAAAAQEPNPLLALATHLDQSGSGGETISLSIAARGDLRLLSATATHPIAAILPEMGELVPATVEVRSEIGDALRPVDIALVVDISASMAGDGRLEALRAGLEAMARPLFQGHQGDLRRVTLIPYAGHVNPGAALFERMGGLRDHMISSCVALPDPVLPGRLLALGPLAQVAHFQRDAPLPGVATWGRCPGEDSALAAGLAGRPALETRARLLRAHEGSAPQEGMIYALALLDPALRPDLEDLSRAGLLPSGLTGRPLDWPEEPGDATKIIVLLAGVLPDDTIAPRQSGFLDPDADTLDNEDGDLDATDGIDFDALNAAVALADQTVSPGGSEIRSSAAQNLAQLATLCDAARDRMVLVYAVNLEAPLPLARVLADCATVPGMALNSTAATLPDTLTAIARQIGRLHLQR